MVRAWAAVLLLQCCRVQGFAPVLAPHHVTAPLTACSFKQRASVQCQQRSRVLATARRRRGSAAAVSMVAAAPVTYTATAIILGRTLALRAFIADSIIGSNWCMWTVLMGAASAGLWSEKTNWGAALSSPLVTMLITISLCNLGILPAASPVYNTVNKMLVPLAVPLLLYDADVRRVVKYAGSLMICFALGSIGTVVGTLAAMKVVPLGLGSDGWKIAAALAARHIGGAVNYVAVAETLNISAGQCSFPCYAMIW
jgi:Protein of unknown function (DUF819)